MKIETGNELIAKFDPRMQWYVPKNIDYNPYWKRDGLVEVKVSNMKYHSSWDWLVPVVKKITPIARGSEGDQFRNVAWADVSGPLTLGDIEGVYTYVVDFIKRYNSQNP